MDLRHAVLLGQPPPRELPEHPVTGLRALGRRKDGSPIWPAGGGADQYWVTPIPPFNPAAPLAFTTFTTAKDVSPLIKPLLYGGQLRVGSMIEVEAWGEYSTTGTPTFRLGIFYGTAAVVLASSALTATATTGAAWPWHMKYQGRVTAVGATGSITGQGFLDLGSSLTVIGSTSIPVTAAARVVAIDTTTNKELGVLGEWGTSSASNSVQTNYLHALLIN